MNYARPFIGLAAAAMAAAVAIPSHAAASRTLFFDTKVKAGNDGCTPTYILTSARPGGDACGGFTVGYMGKGASTGAESYEMLRRSVKGYLDTRRHLTGTVYVSTTPPVGLTVAGVETPNAMGGPIGADITFSVNGVRVGKASGSGITAPGSPLAIKVNLKLPAKLNRKAVRTLEARVDFTGGAGVTIVDNAGDAQSKVVVPVR